MHLADVLKYKMAEYVITSTPHTRIIRLGNIFEYGVFSLESIFYYLYCNAKYVQSNLKK